MENKIKVEIIKKWEDSGLLDGLNKMDPNHTMLKVMESIRKQVINELPDVKTMDDSKKIND
jgi:hypothetical protein